MRGQQKKYEILIFFGKIIFLLPNQWAWMPFQSYPLLVFFPYLSMPPRILKCFYK